MIGYSSLKPESAVAPKLVREFSPTLPTFLHGTNTELSTLNATAFLPLHWDLGIGGNCTYIPPFPILNVLHHILITPLNRPIVSESCYVLQWTERQKMKIHCIGYRLCFHPLLAPNKNQFMCTRSRSAKGSRKMNISSASYKIDDAK